MNIKSAYDYIQWLFYDATDLREYDNKAEAFLNYLDYNRKELGIPDTYAIELEDGLLIFYNEFGFVDDKIKQKLLYS